MNIFNAFYIILLNEQNIIFTLKYIFVHFFYNLSSIENKISVKHYSNYKGIHSLLWPRVIQRRIYYHWLWGQFSTTCSNAIEVAQWATPSCIWLQPPTDDGIRDGRSKWLANISRPSQASLLSSSCTVLISVASAGNLPCNLQYVR